MKNGLKELVFIIDRSGSMSGLEDDTIGGFNAMLQEQQNVEGEAFLTTVLFDDRYELLYDHVDIQCAAPLTRKDYTVRGSTALLDAIGMTIHKIKKIQHSASEESRAEKVLFIIITDGQENASRYYTADMIKEQIEYQKQKYGWEFIFFGANMDAIAEAAKIGIAADRARNYSADTYGTQSAYSAMSAMSSAFRSGVSLDTNAATDDPQSVKAAMANLKRTAAGLLHAAKANSGKLPGINKIARSILSGRKDEEE